MCLRPPRGCCAACSSGWLAGGFVCCAVWAVGCSRGCRVPRQLAALFAVMCGVACDRCCCRCSRFRCVPRLNTCHSLKVGWMAGRFVCYVVWAFGCCCCRSTDVFLLMCSCCVHAPQTRVVPLSTEGSEYLRSTISGPIRKLIKSKVELP